MRRHPTERAERGRFQNGGDWDSPTGAQFGAFEVRLGDSKKRARVISSGEGDDGWEHVSVSYPDRIPTWAEMCAVKEMFWDAEEAVMQLHPPASTYVNNHAFCLHLWRPLGGGLPLPPPLAVGIIGKGVLTKREANALASAVYGGST